MRKISALGSFLLLLSLFSCTIFVNPKKTTTQTTVATTTTQSATSSQSSTLTSTTTQTTLATTTQTTLATTTTDTYVDPSSMDLVIHYIDVGQADSILIQLPNDETILIDAGNNDDGVNVVNYIANLGITKLDYVVGTHLHEDHIGGLDNAIDAFTIGQVYLPNDTSTTATYISVVNSILAKGLTVTRSQAGLVLLDETVNQKTLKAVMVAPNSSSYSETNNYSAVIRLTYGNTNYLFTGDAQTLSEDEILANHMDISADVLKVGHHGSTTSTSQAFLDAVNPKIAVISVGAGNSYGHPEQTILDRLSQKGVDTYRTDEVGTIIVSSDGTHISVDTTTGSSHYTNTSPSVVINEVSVNPASGNEWVELYNTTGESVDISGYSVNGTVIPNQTLLSGEGFYLVNLPTDTLANASGTVSLMKGTITLDSYAYTTSTVGDSWYRLLDGGMWSPSENQIPTPLATNVVYSVQYSHSVVINEILPAPKVPTFSNEWIEFYNPTDTAIDISGYILDDLENAGSAPLVLPTGALVPAHGFYTYQTPSQIFNNSGDDVRLSDPNGLLVDAHSYGSTGYNSSWVRLPDGGAWSDTIDTTPTQNTENN